MSIFDKTKKSEKILNEFNKVVENNISREKEFYTELNANNQMSQVYAIKDRIYEHNKEIEKIFMEMLKSALTAELFQDENYMENFIFYDRLNKNAFSFISRNNEIGYETLMNINTRFKKESYIIEKIKYCGDGIEICFKYNEEN